MMTILFTILRFFRGSKETHLLVMFQNNYELRGSGGFLTQLLDVALGRFKFSPVFRHDYHELKPKEFIQAPPDVQKYLHHKHWHLRDSNLFGDFGASARQVIANYRTLYPHNEPAGAVAVNFHFLEELMEVIGPVRAGSKGFDAANVFMELSTNVSDIDKHNLDELNRRKNILKTLCFKVAKACMARFWKWPRIWSLAKAAISTKDLQFFFTDDRIQSRLLGKGLARQFSGMKTKDFLGVVENNYLGLKSNRYLRRTIFRDVVFELARFGKKLSAATVRVRIEWKHAGHYNYPLSGTYQSVASIHVPLAAQEIKIIHAPEQPSVERNAEDTVVTVHQILGVQMSSFLEFTYRLPAQLFGDDRYGFSFIKQSGVMQEHIHETVRFPDQFRVTMDKRSPREGINDTVDNVLFFDYPKVASDYSYTCVAELHYQPPRIFFHEMVGPGIFDIRFNEPVFKDGDHFSVKVTDREERKKYEVEKVEFTQDNRHMIIHVSGIPNTEEAFYRVTLDGVVNSVGTPVGERKVTAVYRSKHFIR